MFKKKIGVIIHKKSNKTALIQIRQNILHPKYKIIFKKKKNYLIHDNQNLCKSGMIVIIKQIIRLSSRKSWLLYKILH